jgi:hypothetical protein
MNFRYTKNSNPANKEIHSADRSTYICGEHGKWEVYVQDRLVAIWYRREDAREFLCIWKQTKA